MNKDSKTRYYEWTNKDAPRIENTYGSFVAFLDTVLCKGYNNNPVTSLEVLDNNFVKVNLPRGHGYLFNQVVRISDSDQAYYNSDFRVLESRHDYIKIFVEGELTSSNTECLIRIAPLGFTNVFTNTKKSIMCFKNASIKSPGILKVIDEIPPNGYSTSWVKYARIVFGQEIDSSGEFVSNNKAPFYPSYPDAEKTGNGVSSTSGIHGLAKWDYASNDDQWHRENYTPDGSFPRNWTIIGDDKTFYMFIGTTASSRTTIQGFGNYISEDPEESTNLCLQARDSFLTASGTHDPTYARGRNNFGQFSSSVGSFLFSNIYGDIKNIYRYFSQGLYVGDSYYDRPWHSVDINSLNPASGFLASGLSYIKDTSGYVRGYHRGLRMIYGDSKMSSGSVSGSGEIILTVTDPTNDRNATYLFSLKDWENVE